MLASLALALMASAPPAQIHSAASLVQTTTSPAEGSRSEAEIAIARYMETFYRAEFADALKAAESLKVDPSNRQGLGMVTGMRAAALLGLKRKNQADRLYQEAIALNPQEPMTVHLRMMAALMIEDGPVALTAFDRLVARFPDEVRDIDPEIMWFVFQKEDSKDMSAKEDRRIALARLGYGGDTYGDFITASAIRVLIRRGDISGATDLLRYLDEPTDIEDLLIQKRYAALWPALELHAGTKLAKVRLSSAESAKRAYEADSTNWRELAQYVDALRHAGRANEAIALREKLPSTPEAMANMEEWTGWTFNNIAYALHSEGRGDEADQLFATLNQAKIENSGWRVSMVINRLEMLVADQKYDRALALMDTTEATAKRDGNPYSQQLVRRLRYCSLIKLGRAAEAAHVRPEMMKNKDKSIGATIEGLLCAGEHDEAEKLALSLLDTEDGEGSFVRNLQVKPLTGDDPSVWATGWSVLRQRPAIAKEFERLGRDLPEHLYGSAGR